MNGTEKAVAVFEIVRDIPYGTISSRDPGQVLVQGRGTCSGKHLLLMRLFQCLGLPVKLMMCRTSLNMIDVSLPRELAELLSRGEIPDFHNYLKVNVGRWVDVDATFDLPLRRHGFIVSEWDGRTDCRLVLPSIESWEVTDLDREKETALATLSEAQGKRRKDFIDRFSRWLDSLR